MLSPARKRRLASEANALQAILQVGKNGLTEAFLAELDKTLKKKGLVKVKLLRNFADEHDTKTTAEEIAASIKADVVSAVGNVAVFYKTPTKQ